MHELIEQQNKANEAVERMFDHRITDSRFKSQTELAEAIGVDPRDVSKAIKGNPEPKFQRIKMTLDKILPV